MQYLNILDQSLLHLVDTHVFDTCVQMSKNLKFFLALLSYCILITFIKHVMLKWDFRNFVLQNVQDTDMHFLNNYITLLKTNDLASLTALRHTHRNVKVCIMISNFQCLTIITKFHQACDHFKSDSSSAILVPFRDRHQHLELFIDYLHPFLRRQCIHFKIYLISQVMFITK